MRVLMSAPPSSPLHVITLKGFQSKKFLPHHIILASAVQQIKLTHFAAASKSNYGFGSRTPFSTS